MKLLMSLLVLILSASAQAGFTLSKSPAARNICGWIDNPTPGNYWITDSVGEWTISAMNGYHAQGDVAPQDDDNEFVKTNGYYGYYCGCVKATTTDSRAHGRRIAKIFSSRVLPLSKCLNDAKLISTFRPKTLIHSSGKAYTECVLPDEEDQVVLRGRRACVNGDNEYYYLAE